MDKSTKEEWKEYKQKDKRDCPKDGWRMESKGALSSEGDYEQYLYQCPKCKNVEIFWE